LQLAFHECCTKKAEGSKFQYIRIVYVPVYAERITNDTALKAYSADCSKRLICCVTLRISPKGPGTSAAHVSLRYAPLLDPPRQLPRDKRDALHLNLFEQPAKQVFFNILLKVLEEAEDGVSRNSGNPDILIPAIPGCVGIFTRKFIFSLFE